MKNKYILYMTDNMYGNARNNKGKLEFNKKVKPGKCIIPFKYKWKSHDKCYETPKGPICATSVSDRGTLKTYGYCEETGEPIGLGRLKARPIASLSVDAQERHEKMEKIHKDE